MVVPSSAKKALPLAGRHVVITRPGGQEADPLPRLLRDWGARVSQIPLVEIRATDWQWQEPPLSFDWIFFTSRNAVQRFFAGLSSTVQTALHSTPIAVVGPATGQSLQAFGRQPDFVSSRYDAESAALAFCERYDCSGMRVLWPCGNLANPCLSDILSRAGAEVTALAVYETVPRSELSADEVQSLSHAVDMIVFTSPSAIAALLELPLAGGMALDSAAIACLGPKTAQAALSRIGRVDVQSDPVTLEALADAIQVFYETSGA